MLAKAVYENAAEEELVKWGSPEQRCLLLGLFAYQTMEIANISRVVCCHFCEWPGPVIADAGQPKRVAFNAIGYNKLGFGKPMRLALATAKKQEERNQDKSDETEATLVGDGKTDIKSAKKVEDVGASKGPAKAVDGNKGTDPTGNGVRESTKEVEKGIAGDKAVNGAKAGTGPK